METSSRVVAGGGDAVVSQVVTRHYVDGSDNPGWVAQDPDGPGPLGEVSTRFVSGLDGQLGAQIGDDGGLEVVVGNLHGDVVTSVEVPAGGSADALAVGIGRWSDYTENGLSVDAGSAGGDGSGVVYGWLGGHERATLGAGLVLMGARLYNPVTGWFTGPDPVYGGSPSPYVYPTDPVNGLDLDGLRWGWRRLAKYAVVGGAVIGALACGASVVCGIAVGAAAGFVSYSAANAGSRRWSRRGALRATGLGAVSGLGWGGAARGIGWRFTNRFKSGLRFSHSGGRGTDYVRRGSRRFGIHSHGYRFKRGRFSGRRVRFLPHYHRRPGIGRHRPWQGW